VGNDPRIGEVVDAGQASLGHGLWREMSEIDAKRQGKTL
jgi:hypothetical protein